MYANYYQLNPYTSRPTISGKKYRDIEIVGLHTFHSEAWCNMIKLCDELYISFFFSKHLIVFFWKTGTKSVLIPHDGRRQFSLVGIRTYNHSYVSPEPYYCVTGTDIG